MSSGQPYAGPPGSRPPYGPYDRPQYAPPPYGQPPYGQPPYGQPPYGPPPPWGPGFPVRPPRPGQVTGAAVLSFVQAGLVLLATFYVWVLSAMARLESTALHGPTNGGPLAVEGTVLSIVQLLSVGVLIVAGVLALGRRSRFAWSFVLAAAAVQVALAVYWAVRLSVLLSDLPSGAPEGAFSVFTIVFAACPLVTLGLIVFPPGRRWFDGTPRR